MSPQGDWCRHREIGVATGRLVAVLREVHSAVINRVQLMYGDAL